MVYTSLGKLATESLSKTTKVTKTAHIFDFSPLYNNDFDNFVKNDNELNLSSVGFVSVLSKVTKPTFEVDNNLTCYCHKLMMML